MGVSVKDSDNDRARDMREVTGSRVTARAQASQPGARRPSTVCGPRFNLPELSSSGLATCGRPQFPAEATSSRCGMRGGCTGVKMIFKVQKALLIGAACLAAN